LRRKRHHVNDKSLKRSFRTSARTKDLDQRYEELQKTAVDEQSPKGAEVDPELPGMGQHYCIHCARHFINEHSLTKHKASKVHKRRVKDLAERPFDPEIDPC